MKPIVGEREDLAVAMRSNTNLSLRDIAKEVSEVFYQDVSHEWVRQVCAGRSITPREPKTEHAGKLRAWRSYNQRIREQAMNALGGVCSQCGYSDQRVLEIDHIEGGGREHRKRVDHKAQYRNIRDGQTEGYQLLCSNCHGIKSYEERMARYETE